MQREQQGLALLEFVGFWLIIYSPVWLWMLAHWWFKG